MLNFVPTKKCLRVVLLPTLEKSAAERYAETYINSPSERTCREWFQGFRESFGDYDVKDKERSGAPTEFEDEELET